MPKKAATGRPQQVRAEPRLSPMKEHTIVSAYLNALAVSRRRGRRVTRESLEGQIQRNAEQLASTTSTVDRLLLVQKGLDLTDRLERLDAEDSFEDMESDFVTCAASYAKRKGISYAAWREIGVTPEVLQRAGIARHR